MEVEAVDKDQDQDQDQDYLSLSLSEPQLTSTERRKEGRSGGEGGCRQKRGWGM
jgi:hypothetical protein